MTGTQRCGRPLSAGTRIGVGWACPLLGFGMFLGLAFISHWWFGWAYGPAPALALTIAVVLWIAWSLAGLFLLWGARPTGALLAVMRSLGVLWCLAPVILITMALPSMTFAIAPAGMTREVASARAIATALLTYAHENNGQFPDPPEATDANAAFRALFRAGAIDQERAFWSADSPFCRDISRIDGVFTDAAGVVSPAECLRPGENQWGYVAGLDLDAPGDTPIVFQGFTGPGATYDRAHPFFRERGAIVGFVDGSAYPMKIDRRTGRVVDRQGRDLFTGGRLPSKARLLPPR